ncbi:Uncharacterised protein g8437 [Pycnogonum litorale]
MEAPLQSNKFVMATICFGALANYLIYSVVAPVFPAEAQRKGLTSSYYTLVFAVHGLVQFTASPLLGKYIIDLGCKFVLVWGLVFTGVSASLFGMLQFCPDKWSFFWLAIVLRMFEGFGTCAFFTSAYIYVMRMYPKTPGAAFGTIEMFGSFGYVIGPVFGSILLHFGEFWVPLVVTGIVLLINALLAVIIVPDAHSDVSDQPQGTKEFFSIPMVIYNYVLILLQMIYLSYFLALTEEHLVKIYHVNLIHVGIFLMVVSILYSLSSPVSGYVGDRFNIISVMQVIGCVACAGACVCFAYPLMAELNKIGPDALWVPYIGAFLFGIGSGPLHACTFSKVRMSAVNAGMPDDMNTQSLVSSWYNATHPLGNFIGGAIAGVMMEYLGYDWSNIIFGMLFVLMALSVPIAAMAQRKVEIRRSKSMDFHTAQSETAHLLIGNSETFF